MSTEFVRSRRNFYADPNPLLAGPHSAFAKATADTSFVLTRRSFSVGGPSASLRTRGGHLPPQGGKVRTRAKRKSNPQPSPLAGEGVARRKPRVGWGPRNRSEYAYCFWNEKRGFAPPCWPTCPLEAGSPVSNT